MKRFIWDFRGRDGHQTAVHHCKHLDGFAKIYNIPSDTYKAGTVQEKEYHTYSFLEIEEAYQQKVIDLLKPQRTEE